MKKTEISLYFLFILTLTTGLLTFSLSSFADNSEPRWKQFFQRYCTSVGVGAFIGLSTDLFMDHCLNTGQKLDKINAKIDQKLANFFLKSFVKFVILKHIKKDMLRDNIPHKNSLMFVTALLTFFRDFWKDACLGLFESDSCKCLLNFLKNRLSILWLLS